MRSWSMLTTFAQLLPLIVRKNKVGRNAKAVDRDVVELVRDLALVQPGNNCNCPLKRRASIRAGRNYRRIYPG
jgi:hypothetical protein